MSYAFYCEACDGEGVWELLRHGDAVVTWACDKDLAPVMARLQRRGEVTEVSVKRNHFLLLMDVKEALADG